MFSQKDSDKYSQRVYCWEIDDEKPGHSGPLELSKLAAREGKQGRLMAALRSWLSRPRVNKAYARDTTEGVLVATTPTLDFCFLDVFESSRRLLQRSIKDRLLFDSSVFAEECDPPYRFTPLVEARFAFEQLHLDGNPADKVLRFHISMFIDYPDILNRSLLMNVVPIQPGDFTVNLVFLDHPVGKDADPAAAPVFRAGKPDYRTRYNGKINLRVREQSGITISFCRGCEASYASMDPGYDGVEAYDKTVPRTRRRTADPAHFSHLAPERRDWELLKRNAPVTKCPLIKGHSVPIARCAIKVVYTNGRYWPRLEALPN